MIARIDEARSAGDTVGGVFEVVVHGLPIGLGSYVHWDRRLDAALAAAVMSINIVKGVEFGLGFEQTRRFGSAVHDVIEGRGDDGRWIHRTNNAGGLTGGVTNGEPLVVRGAVKPISTLARPLPSADLVTGEAVDKAHYERSDISVVPAAGVVAEAMVMLTLAAFVLEKFGGDTMDDVRAALDHYRARIATAPEAPVAGGRRARGRRPRRRARPDRHRRGRLRRRRLRPAMDVVLVGLPGSGKSVVGRAAGPSPRAPSFIDLDERIESAAGRSIPEIFEEDGEAAFRALERAAIADLGPADRGTGGPPRDRDRRRRRRRPAQPLGALPRPDAGLARRPARGPRPAAAPLAARPAARRRPRPDRRRSATSRRRRERFYAAADIRQSGRRRGPGRRRRDRGAARRPAGRGRDGTDAPAGGDADRAVRPRRRDRRPPRWRPSSTRCGRAGPILGQRAGRVGGGRRAARGRRCARAAGRSSAVMLPAGRGGQAAGGRRDGGARAGRGCGSSAASRSSRSAAARSATRPGSSPRPTCAASRSSRSRRRSSPRSTRRSAARPASTCPRARTCVGAFHQPAAVVIDVATAADAPRAPAPGRARRGGQDGRARRRAAVRAARADGAAIARGDAGGLRRPAPSPRSSSAAAWAKVEVVMADERERGAAGGRITLNLGHSLGHAVEAAAGYGGAAPRRGGRLRAPGGVRGSASRPG